VRFATNREEKLTQSIEEGDEASSFVLGVER
jgi:hypothetical protein